VTRNEIAERIMNLALAVYKLEKDLCKTYSGKHLYNQLFRSATSVGANYEEATAAESKKDFIHKMQISLKEIRETHYWIRFIRYAQISSIDQETLNKLSQESLELSKILGKAVSSAKNNVNRM